MRKLADRLRCWLAYRITILGGNDRDRAYRAVYGKERPR